MNRKIKWTYLLVFLFSATNFYSQTISYGGSFTFGYKTLLQEQGISAYVRIKRKIDLQVGYAVQGKYNGEGLGGGLRWVILDKKIQPFIGISSSYNFGRKVNLASDGVKGIYTVSSNSMLLGESGMMFKLENSSAKHGNKLTVLLIGTFTYRHPLDNYSVNFIEMDYSEKAKANLYNRVGKGFGGSIALVILFSGINSK